MTVRFPESVGHRGRLFKAGKTYKVVDRPTDEDDEISKAHAAELVEIGKAEKVTQRSTRPARARHTRAAKKAAPAESKAADDDGTPSRG